MMAEWTEPTVSDQDRLPWLETVEDEEEGGSAVRVGVLVIIGLLIVAVAVFGWRWFEAHRAPAGDGTLIAAQEGDYKLRPDDPGGMKVEGEGDTAIATSEGKAGGAGAIDLNRAPEAPVAARPTTKPKSVPTGSATAVAEVPASGGRLVAQPPAGQPGSLVQIGSYPDEATADAAWAAAARRYAFLAGLGKSVRAAEVGGRRTYRLRVNAGSTGAATALCGRLKAAGQACFVPRG